MSESKTNRPNIVFLLSDQQRWDTCGCYGQRLDVTPTLDRMAREGVRFEHAFTCQPVCGPARACLQTGKYATEVGCHTNHRLLPTDEQTLAHILAKDGYDTAYIGKWHLASSGPINGEDDFRTRPVPTERRGGYDYWLATDALESTSHSYDGYMFDGEGRRRDFPEGRFRADVLTDWAIEYLDTRRGGAKPFFLFLSWIEPHHQNDHGHFEGPRGSRERFADFDPPGDLVDSKGDWQAEYPDYLGCCRSLDDNVGRLLDRLEALGMTDDTLVIYTSDHGSHFRTRNKEYKRSCHDGCIRIPMIMRGPSFEGGASPSNLVSLIDLPPTVLTTAGVTPPAAMRGRPLQALTGAMTEPWPDEVFLQISESQCGRAIRSQRWTYSVRAPGDGNHAPSSAVYVEDCLYDLEADPHQQNNLVSDPALAEVRRELALVLKRRMREAGEAEPEIRPAAAGAERMPQ